MNLLRLIHISTLRSYKMLENVTFDRRWNFETNDLEGRNDGDGVPCRQQDTLYVCEGGRKKDTFGGSGGK